MAAIKLNLSVDPQIAEALRRRAREEGKPASRYLSELVQQDVRRHRDELAAAGYRELSQDTGVFAEAALPLASETWPVWEERRAPEAR